MLDIEKAAVANHCVHTTPQIKQGIAKQVQTSAEASDTVPLHQTLPPQVLEGPLTHDVALDVLALDVLSWVEGLILSIAFQLLVECDSFLDFRNLLEVCSVWNLEAAHAKFANDAMKIMNRKLVGLFSRHSYRRISTLLLQCLQIE